MKGLGSKSSQNIRPIKSIPKANTNKQNTQNNHNTQIKLSQSSLISKSSEKESFVEEDSRARLTSSEPINKTYTEMQDCNSVSLDNVDNTANAYIESKSEVKLPFKDFGSASHTEFKKTDELEVSRYPIINPVDVTITKMQEIKLQQKLLKELKFVASLDERVLKEQHYYWLFTNNIVNEDARSRMKSALEIYCTMPMQWISGTELEIDVNPEHRIEKVPNHKKKV
jgi:hypothetical protein